MIVVISPTHAQFTSLLYTLAYMFWPFRAIIRESQITKDCRLKCVSMNKIPEFFKNISKIFKTLLKLCLLLVYVVLCVCVVLFVVASFH
jgi:hypothetical protein